MRLKYPLATFVVLSVTWFLWSGHTEPLLLGFGLASSLGVVALSMRMKILDEESQLYVLGWRPLTYAPWLLWEIAKANVAVARRILDPQLGLSPKLIFVHPSQRTAVARVVYANSITLTPGTVTLDVQQGRLLVHALTEDAAYDLAQGEMDRRVSRLEATPEPAP